MRSILLPLFAFAPLLGGCATATYVPVTDVYMATVSTEWLEDIKSQNIPIVTNTAFLRGVLAVEDNCLVSSNGEDASLAIFPAGFLLQRNGDQLVVLNAEDRRVAKVGEAYEAGGGSFTFNPKNLQSPVPERCKTDAYISIQSIK